MKGSFIGSSVSRSVFGDPVTSCVLSISLLRSRYAAPLDDDDDDELDHEHTSEVHYSVISYFISLSLDFGVYLEVDARDF